MKIKRTILTRHLLLGISVLLGSTWMAAVVLADTGQASDAREILEKSDDVRNPAVPFSTHITLIEYHSAKEVDRSVLKVHSKQQKQSGQYRSLVKFMHPVRDEGKLMLQNGNEIWFYDPAAKNSIRLSAQQRLMGQASNGDVMTANFALDYDVSLVGEENIMDAKRQSQAVYRLRLTAKNEDVTYAFADYWVEKTSSYPIKAKFYSSSQRLMKIAYYANFQMQLGRMRPTQVLIIDGVDTSKVTRMQMKDYREISIPEAWFQRSFLPRFKG